MSTQPPRRFHPGTSTGPDENAPRDALVNVAGADTGGPWSPGSAWRNWGRSQTAQPVAVARPADTTQLQDVLGVARERGLSVRPVGSGHSFTGIAVAPGIQLDLGLLSGLVEIDTATRRATFGAGTRLADIPASLAPYGLAMENLGDVDRQTLAGATSTGTHGTGARFGGISTQICGVRLVTPDGRELSVSAEQNPQWWGAVQVGLGALGILTEITLQCVPAFALRAVEAPAPLADVLETWDQRCADADHFEFYWFPGTATASTKTNHRVPADTELHPRSTRTHFVDDTVMSNGVYRGICAVASRVPSVVPAANAFAARVMARHEYTELSHHAFVTSRTVRFREMEFGLPLDAVPDVLRDLDAMIRRKNFRISFPVEVRAAAADDLWLSTATGRASGYVAVHRYHREDYRPYFRAAQEIFRAYDGRPHWGKLHSVGADQLAQIYPRYADFVAVRDQLDPERALANPYLDRVLGR